MNASNEEKTEFENLTTTNDIYIEHPSPIEPHAIYFYYKGATRIESYYFDNGSPITDLRKAIELLTLNARYQAHMPPPIPGPIGKFKWRRKSYIVIVFDDQQSVFVPGDGVRIIDDGTPGSHPNHSFFNGADFTMNVPVVPAGIPVSVFHCINYMQGDAAGNPIGATSQTFKFEIKVERGGVATLASESGTNMGPPVPPPAFLALDEEVAKLGPR